MENPALAGMSAPSHPVIAAAQRMREILLREAAAARQASLSDLQSLQEEKQEAIEILAQLDAERAIVGDMASEVRNALRAMLAAADENRLVLASVAGALESVQERLRTDLAAVTNPGTYTVASTKRRRPFSLAASIDQTA